MLLDARYVDIVAFVTIVKLCSELYASCDSGTQGFRHIGMGVTKNAARKIIAL
jgi:hypothetical protein